MAKLTLDNVAPSTITTPSAGATVLFPDSTSKEWCAKDDAARIVTLRPLTNAGSTTTAGADIYIVGSNILVPPQLVRVGSTFMWRLSMSKTAACTSAPVYNVRIGTAGTVGGDTARLTWTQATNQTAATDNGMLEIFCTVTTASSSGIINGGFLLNHTNAATGFSTAQTQSQGPTASGAFDLTVASSIFGLSINPGNTGANAVWTITCVAQAFNL